MRMEALEGLAVAGEVQELLESLLGSGDASQQGGASPTATNERKSWLLQEAFAQVQFFANLPTEVRELCSLEPFTVSQLAGKAGDESGALFYRQGAKLEDHAGLFVLLHGEVVLETHAHDAQPKSLGAEKMLLRPGDAFGDEALFAEYESASVARATSAVVPQHAVVIRLTSNKVLRAIGGWLMQQPSLLYFLHPRSCLDALRKDPAKRSPTELMRVAQCIDAVGVFGSQLDEEMGLEVASTVNFADVLPGQLVFQEGDPMDECFVLIHGRTILCQDGAAPDSSHPHNPCPKFGNTIDELCAGDVLIDPAPWFRGAWPCSAVAATRVGVAKIRPSTHAKLRQSDVTFQPRQFLQLLGKPAGTRTRLDNQRVAQFLSAFPSMQEVALDKRIELAGFMNLATFDSGQQVSAKAHQEFIALSGHARVVEDEPSATAPGGEAEHSMASRTFTGSKPVSWLRLSVAKGFSLRLAVRLSMHCDLSKCIHEVLNSGGHADADATRTAFLGKVAPFLSCVEALMLKHSLQSIEDASLNNSATDTMPASFDVFRASPEKDVMPGDVIGWHLFPSRNRKGINKVHVLAPMSVAVLMHRDVEGSEAAHIFRRGSACIQPQSQIKLTEALRSSPQYRSPEDLADIVTSLKNVPPFSVLQPTQPEAVRKLCEQISLRELPPGAKIFSQGRRVEEILIILQGTMKSIVSSKEVCGGQERPFWVSVRTAAKFLRRAKRSGDSQHMTHHLSSKHTIRHQSTSKRPQSALHAHYQTQPALFHHALSEEEETRWDREHECIAVYGPGDNVGFADMIGGSWCSSLIAGFKGCSVAAIPRHMLEGHCNYLLSSMSASVSPGSCTGVLSVPRRFTAQEQLMTLHMMLVSIPSFASLSEKCVAKLASRALHMHLSTHQLLYVQGDDAEVYALVMKGRLASYCGLPDAVRAIISPHPGGYVDLQQLHLVAPTSLSQELHRLKDDSDSVGQLLEDEALWEQNEIDLDLDGNLSYRKGQTCIALGNIRHELTELNAPPALLAQCRLKVTGPAPVGQASKSEREVNLGHASNLVVLHFGRVMVTFWCGDKDVLCFFLLCIVRHWISRAGHPLGSLVKTVEAEGEVGTALLHSSRPPSRARQHLSASTTNHALDHDERPLTANDAGRPSTVEACRGTVAKNATSISALEPSELLLLTKNDVEEVMVELCSEQLLGALKSLGPDGAILAKEMEETHHHLLPDIVRMFEPTQFEPTQFLFHARKCVKEIFLITAGKVNLLVPFSGNVPKETQTDGPRGHMPAVRGHRKADKLVGVSLVQGPCFLGMHKNTQTKVKGVANGDSAEAVHGLSAQAVTSVEAYALKMPPASANIAMGDSASRFLDKFLKCLDRLSMLQDEGMSKMRVANGTTVSLSRPISVAASEPLPLKSQDEHLGGHSASKGSKKRVGLGRYDTQASVRGAAADLGANNWRSCLDAGVEDKNYRKYIQCPNCMRLTYPEQQPNCHLCGMLCEGRVWQPKLGAMDAAAVSTVEHLLNLRDLKRKVEEPDSKPGMRHEQLSSSYATVMSCDSNYVLSLSHHEESLSAANELDHVYFEDKESDQRAKSPAQTEVVLEVVSTPIKQEAQGARSQSHVFTLRPRTSDGIMGIETGDFYDKIASPKPSDTTKPAVKRLARPKSSAPSIGHGIGTSSSVAIEMDALAREQKRFVARGKAAMKSSDATRQSRRQERARSALGNPSAAVSAYFNMHGRPSTSPVTQKYLGSRPQSSLGFGSASKPPSSDSLPTQFDITGLAAYSTTFEDRSTFEHQPTDTPQLPADSPFNNLQGFRARRYAHTLLSVLKSNPAWCLDTNAAGQEIHTAAHWQGPSPFLVSSSTRSQVILRRSAPKYQRLAKLNVGKQGAIF